MKRFYIYSAVFIYALFTITIIFKNETIDYSPEKVNFGDITNNKDIDYIAPINVNGKDINFTYTDDNTGEDLIIATDSSTYSSWDYADVFFAVKNISGSDQNIKIQFSYNGGAETTEVEEILFDVPYQVTVNEYGIKDYTCNTDWVYQKNDGMPFDPQVYTCEKETPRHCDKVVGNICTVNDDLIGNHNETRYKDVFVSVNKTSVENLENRNVKVIPNEFVTKEQFSNMLLQGQTKYYKAKLKFNNTNIAKKQGDWLPETNGEFYINVYGDNGGIGHLDPWYNASWLYRKAITIDQTKVTGSSNHSNFPVLVDLTDSDLATDAQADGDDILFTSSDGTTKLDHDLEVFTSATGRVLAWVEVPTLDFDDNTIIYMYYGNAGATNQENVTATWETNFKGVWHQPDGTTQSLVDSTSNGGNGTNNSSTATTSPFYGGSAFSGSSQYWTVADNDIYSFGNGTTDSPFTISTWVKVNNSTASNSFVDKYPALGANAEYVFGLNGGAMYGWVADASASAYRGRYVTSISSYISNSTWTYVAWTYDGGGLTSSSKLYVNGVQRDNTDFSGATYTAMENGTRAFSVAQTNGGMGAAMAGAQDEVRLYAGVRSSDWLLTEYNNQSSTSTFYTIGTEETNTATGATLLEDGWFMLFN